MGAMVLIAPGALVAMQSCSAAMRGSDGHHDDVIVETVGDRSIAAAQPVWHRLYAAMHATASVLFLWPGWWCGSEWRSMLVGGIGGSTLGAHYGRILDPTRGGEAITVFNLCVTLDVF